MEPAQLDHFIKQAETSADQEHTIVKLLGMLSRGELKREEVQAHYKRENLSTFNSYVHSFGRGELFQAQRMNFTAWVDGKHYAQDWELALNVKATGESCGFRDNNSQAFRDLWFFVIKMVMLHPYQRQERVKWQGENKFREAWSRRQIQEGWQSWQAA
jgi:hypothetical protein